MEKIYTGEEEDLQKVVSNSEKNITPGDGRVVDFGNTLEAHPLKRDGSEENYYEAYSKYQLRGQEGSFFVLSPNEREKIAQATDPLSSVISQALKNDSEGRVKEWGSNSTISAIQAKGLVLESVKYSKRIGEEVAKAVEESPLDNFTICELCVGAGITSSFIYLEAKKRNPEKSIQIHAVDYSERSVGAAVAMFETQGIPYMVLKNAKDISKVAPTFEGVVLVVADAVKYLEDTPLVYDSIVSENGISYFDTEKHKYTLGLMLQKTKSGGLLALASLNPKLMVSLGKMFLVSQALSGGDRYREYVERIKNGHNPYVVKSGKIERAMTPESGGQIEFMRYLFTHSPKDLVRYLSGLTMATKAAEILISEIRSPISVSEEILSSYGLENLSRDWNMEGAPCDVLTTKV